MTIIVNPELRSLIPALDQQELDQLEANLRADGCTDALVVWQETNTLLDGHHRLEICTRHDLDYRIQEISLPDLDAAKAWMIANQLGRRNLTPEQMSYFRGKQYEMQKLQGKRTDLTSRQNGEKLTNPAATLAAMHRVGERTIERDGAYARAIDAIAEVAGPQSRQALLARETKLTQQEVQQLADVAKVSPPTVQEVMASMQVAKTPKAAKQIVHLAVEVAQKQVATGDNGTLAKAGVSRATLTRLAPMPKAAQAEQAEAPAPPLTPADDLGDLLEQARSSLGRLYSSLTRPTHGWLPLAPEQVEALAQQAAACSRLGDCWRGVQEALTASEAFRLACQPAPQPAAASPEDAPVTPAETAQADQGTRKAYGRVVEAVLQTLPQIQPCTNIQMAQATGEKPKDTHRAFKSLITQGLVRKDDQQYWAVDEEAAHE